MYVNNKSNIAFNPYELPNKGQNMQKKLNCITHRRKTLLYGDEYCKISHSLHVT
jgi:hypothetical protein